jgi:putative NADH-flavin reductase
MATNSSTNKQITVIGASGRTGIPLVEQALQAGYQVKALVRNRQKLPIQHSNLTVVEGDAKNASKIEEAVKGSQAVLMMLGHTPTSEKDILAESTKHVIAAMKKYQVKRLINLTGAGVRFEGDPSSFGSKFMRFLLKTLAGKLLEDSIHQKSLITKSGLDWVIVRGPRLLDGPHTGKYQTGYLNMGPGQKINRADVADFMLKLVNDNTYLHKAPMICY